MPPTHPHFELSAEELTQARVLVVDDEPLVTRTLASFFQVELELEPICFNDPTAALAYALENEIDLALSDFLMPRLNGLELLRALRDAKPEVPRILLTGYADKENAIASINEVRLFHYIEKPWENAHVKRVVINALSHRHLQRLVFEKLAELDTAASELRAAHAALVRAFF